MKSLKNTVYISSPYAYLSLKGENLVIVDGDKEVGRVPLHNLQSIVSFGYRGASPALMGACAERDINLCFLSQSRGFLGRVQGKTRKNVLLRKEQYLISEDPTRSLPIARNFITGKILNTRQVIERATRDYPARVDVEKFKGISSDLRTMAVDLERFTEEDQLRGAEGSASKLYFSMFSDLILQQKDDFFFNGRNRRPPLDNTNALLSFSYMLLAHMCEAALEAVGLDPYVGFLHKDRPGRASLALDLMEELRPIMADRFVFSLINKQIVNGKGFERRENGAIVMNEKTKRTVIEQWQNRSKEEIKHPFLGEKVEWGMVPYAQALLLARYIRGDLDGYPPFLWK